MTAGGGRLHARRFVVIGASAGIGRAIAQGAVRDGADVVFVGRRLDRLESAIAEAGGGHAVAADLVDADACEATVSAAVGHLGTIDAMVFCAGVSGLARLRDTTADEWRRILDVNVVAPSLVTAAVVPHVAESGLVAYLSSESVGRPRHGLVPYSASKAALEELVRGWRTEHPDRRFCCITVGATEGTEFARDFDSGVAAELFPIWLAHGHMAAALMPVGQVADAVLGTVALALDQPSVDVHDVVLRPPGPLMQGTADALVELVDTGKEVADG